MLALLLVLLAAAHPAAAQTPPTPTPVDIPSQPMLEALATQNAALYSLPPVPELPANRSGEILAYAKWLTSPQTAQEIFDLFAPIFTALGVLIGVEVTLNVIYVAIWIIAQVVRWVIWLIKTILQVIQGISAAADSLLGWLFKFRRIL